MDGQNFTGRLLGQYELKELLGRGGMGAVYRAYQSALDRHVAIKVISLSVAQEPGYAERFTREAKMAASLEHPHIVPVYDYGIDNAVSYVVMRLLTGGSLEQRLRQSGAFSLTEIALLLAQLASALEYAHSRGLIHRDIKPSNVMFDARGDAYLVDFGIAKLLQSSQSFTTHTTMLGTPSYMSPEQWMDSDLTPASDQYALGILTYQLLTGELPFEATTPYALMHKHLNEVAAPPQVRRPDIPVSVSAVVQRALGKTPADRFSSVTAFATAFDAATREIPGELATMRLTPTPSPPLARPEPPAETAPAARTRPQRSSRPPMLVAVLLGLILVALSALILLTLRQAPLETAQSTNAILLSTLTDAPLAQTEELPTARLTDTPVPTATTPPPSVTPTQLSPTATPITPIIQYVYVTVEATICPTETVLPTETNTPAPTLTGYQNFTLGMAAFENSDYDAAIEYFTLTIRLDPAYTDAYHYRASSYQQIGEFSAALTDFEAVIALNPELPDAYGNIAQIYFDQQDYAAALNYVDSALALYEEASYWHYLRAAALVGLEDYAAAVSAFTRALELDPEATYIYGDRGWAYFDLGDPEATIADFQTYLASNEGYVELYQTLGDAQLTVGDLDAALDAFQTALQMDGYNPYILQQLGDLLFDLGREDEALSYYYSYVGIVGDSGESYIYERIAEIEDAADDE